MTGSTLISVPRADWQGYLDQFVSENAPFMPDYEMDRIIDRLKTDGHAEHKAGAAGVFGILIVPAPASVEV